MQRGNWQQSPWEGGARGEERGREVQEGRREGGARGEERGRERERRKE